MKKIIFILVGIVAMLQGIITPATASDESFQLLPGANLLAYPVSTDSTISSADLLASFNDLAGVSSIQRYNTESGLFETCVWKNGTAGGAIFPIAEDEGYIVHATDSLLFQVSGDRICPEISLSPGLNLTSFPCAATGYNSQQLLQDLGPAAIAVKTQNPANNAILTTTRENDIISGDTFDIAHGHSYLVYMDAETSWYPVDIPSSPTGVEGFAGDQMAILQWVPPAGTIIGYNVYRTATSGSNYEKLNTGILQGTEYTDLGLSNGSPWYYVISAIDQYGRETGYSSQVAVTPANTGPTAISGGTVISTNAVWSLVGSPYTVSDSITVSPGATLTLEPGVIVEFHTGRFDIDGKLTAKGTADHPILFRADDGSWTGLRFDTADSIGSILEYCLITDASTPVAVENSNIEISHCSIESTSSNGLYYRWSGGHIHHTDISGSYSTMRGIYLYESSPLIEYNNITSPGTGIYMYGDSIPQILHNRITEFNANGLDLSGTPTAQPYPTLTGNTIETNRGGSSTYLLRATSYDNNPAAGTHHTVNAKNNYWGTTDPQILTASIAQWGGGTSDRPYVDFSEFLDRPDGTVVPGHFIPAGPLSASELSWTPAESPYIVLGHALVDIGDTLTIAPGTEIQFAGGGEVYGYRRSRFSSLQVLGKLTAVGTPELPIYFLSESNLPEKSDWYGIIFLDGYDNNSVVSYCKIEHAFRAVLCTGGSMTITHNEIIAGEDYGDTYAAGIRLELGNTSTITDNNISGYDYYDSSGIYIRGSSSPTISGNILEANRNGLYFRGDSTRPSFSTAQVSNNSILNSTDNSVYLYGTNNDATNPQPVFSNNTFIAAPSVASASFHTTSYGSGTAITINAQNNWWGTYDADDIAVAVYDKKDNSYSPLVDYRFFLDDVGGTPGTGNQVLGNLAADVNVTWTTADSPVIVMGDLNIPPTTTLTIEAGVDIWMSSGQTLNGDGELIVNGTVTNPVTFSAGNMTASPTEWEGINLIGSSNDDSVLSYCNIKGAKRAIYLEDCSPLISHCTITSGISSGYTIRLLRSDATIEYCTLNNLAPASSGNHGLYLEFSSPSVQYNTIADMHYAISLTSSSNPQILHNSIIDFTYTGIDLYGYSGDCFPVINNNVIQTSRGDYNTWCIRSSYYANDPQNGSIQTIDVKNNYWGTADPQLISAGIDQWSGENTDPIIDFSNFLDAPGGSPVSGHFIAPGQITELTWDAAQGPYIILGHIFIANGETLTIPSGTEIKFLGGDAPIFDTTRHVRSSLRIYGKLSASGTETAPILFYSNHGDPTEGDWSGIFFYDNADDTSIISYSTIEDAYNSVYCIGATPEISNNTILAGAGSAYSSYIYGVRLEAGSDATVSNNLISGFNYSGAHGLYILDSSPTISGNTIEDNYYGIYIKDGSPAISSNIISGNYYGLYLRADSSTTTAITPSIDSNIITDSSSRTVHIYGSGNDATSPYPVFNNNSFVALTSPERSFEATYYSSPSSISLNAANNWWGTSVQSEIESIIWDHADYSRNPVITFKPYLTQAIPSSLIYNIDLSERWFSPNGDTTQDSTTISWQGSADISNWTVTVKDSAGQTVRTEAVGSATQWTWDGNNDSSVQVPDGQYTLVISGSNANGSVERSVSVNVDTQPVATIQINSPVESATLQNIFDITATVQDGNLDNFTLEIGKGSSPGSWDQLETGSADIDNVLLYTLESNTIDTDTIPSLPTIGELTDGPYTLRLTATDLAGNTTAVERSISLANVFITNVSITELVADPAINQSAAIEYSIDKTADVELRIYTETDGDTDQLVRIFRQSALPAGTHSFSWDGRDDSSELVGVGGYIFVLSATSSGLTDQFKQEPVLNIPALWTPGSTFNSSTNDWFTSDCQMADVTGRYRVAITPSGEPEFTVFTNYYPAHESFIFTWDGRRPDGTLVNTNTSFWIHDTWGNANILIVSSSSAPEVTGQAPDVNVKSDPFLINFCYGEQTSLLYNLDRQAEITITLFPIDEDASSPDAIVLVNQEIQSAGDHTVSWNAADDTDPRNVLFSREGLYTFTIEATTNGITSTSRGVISLYK